MNFSGVRLGLEFLVPRLNGGEGTDLQWTVAFLHSSFRFFFGTCRQLWRVNWRTRRDGHTAILESRLRLLFMPPEIHTRGAHPRGNCHPSGPSLPWGPTFFFRIPKNSGEVHGTIGTNVCLEWTDLMGAFWKLTDSYDGLNVWKIPSTCTFW